MRKQDCTLQSSLISRKMDMACSSASGIHSACSDFSLWLVIRSVPPAPGTLLSQACLDLSQNYQASRQIFILCSHPFKINFQVWGLSIHKQILHSRYEKIRSLITCLSSSFLLWVALNLFDRGSLKIISYTRKKTSHLHEGSSLSLTIPLKLGLQTLCVRFQKIVLLVECFCLAGPFSLAVFYPGSRRRQLSRLSQRQNSYSILRVAADSISSPFSISPASFSPGSRLAFTLSVPPSSTCGFLVPVVRWCVSGTIGAKDGMTCHEDSSEEQSRLEERESNSWRGTTFENKHTSLLFFFGKYLECNIVCSLKNMISVIILIEIHRSLEGASYLKVFKIPADEISQILKYYTYLIYPLLCSIMYNQLKYTRWYHHSCFHGTCMQVLSHHSLEYPVCNLWDVGLKGVPAGRIISSLRTFVHPPVSNLLSTTLIITLLQINFHGSDSGYHFRNHNYKFSSPYAKLSASKIQIQHDLQIKIKNSFHHSLLIVLKGQCDETYWIRSYCGKRMVKN
ncbi:hypothetical protein VP01_57g1 [Puccinia sorghi]|uniref:Uncharacterized protein n=1 Tax=Puccinia sorghi TaxID=27349 RepID=A0A0L6UI72_9BASI|nr:hypothetical protein VP01_57g1 [Puccinia sorghi]